MSIICIVVEFMDWWIYPLIGALSGFIAGLLGVGGGIILTPVLMFTLSGPIEAIATSLASMTISTTVSVWMHIRKKTIDFGAYRKMLPGLLMGSLLGAYLA
ncbi:MAG: TSUP family transporter, partial [Chlamydiia bacterium]